MRCRCRAGYVIDDQRRDYHMRYISSSKAPSQADRGSPALFKTISSPSFHRKQRKNVLNTRRWSKLCGRRDDRNRNLGRSRAKKKWSSHKITFDVDRVAKQLFSIYAVRRCATRGKLFTSRSREKLYFHEQVNHEIICDALKAANQSRASDFHASLIAPRPGSKANRKLKLKSNPTSSLIKYKSKAEKAK